MQGALSGKFIIYYALDLCRKLTVCTSKANRRATTAVALLNSGARYARTEAKLYGSKRISLASRSMVSAHALLVRIAGR